jgi:hypothetical protein
LALLLLAALPCPALAGQKAADPVEILRIEVGLSGCYKPGLWTPVAVTLRGGSQSQRGELSITVPDGDGVPSRVSTGTADCCLLPAGQESRVLLYVRFGRVRSEARVEFRAADGGVTRRLFKTAEAADEAHFPPALLPSQQLILVVGPGSVGVDDAAAMVHQDPAEKCVVARVESFDRLPDRWYGYEGVDLVVLATSRPQIYAGLKPGDPRIKALAEWLQMGGRLLLCAGQQADQVLRPGGPLAAFAPGRFQEMTRLRQMGAIESFCGSTLPLTPADPEGLPVPVLADAGGVVEIREADLPLLVRQARGFGQLVFLALDPDQPPLANWADRGRLMARLLNLSSASTEESGGSRAMLHYGFTDMAGQLRSALDCFPGVGLVPFWIVVALVIAYLLAIGPGDYFLLGRLLRRMQWTWVSFPLLVALVTAGALTLARAIKGDRVQVSQVDLIDVDAASGRVRGTTWANVFSPTTEPYTISLSPRRLRVDPVGNALRGVPQSEKGYSQFAERHGGRSLQVSALAKGTVPFSSDENWDSPLPDSRPIVSWLGLPGAALGGMNPRASDPTVWKGGYRFSPGLETLSGVPIPIWSTKSFTARWTSPAGAFAVPEAKLAEEDRVPTGTVNNPFDFPLHDCLLAYGNWVYELGESGTMQPHQTVTVGSMLMRRELRTFLTGRKTVLDDDPAHGKDKFHEELTPYDQGSVDVAYVLRAMMFFRAAGGRAYTGLWNRYQGFVDCSDLLQANRAVLVAGVPNDVSAGRHGADLLSDGRPMAGPHDPHKVIYRFVFPVSQ